MTKSNPLIKENKADTMAAIKDCSEWLCRVSESDEDVHPGMYSALVMLHGAIVSVASGDQLDKETDTQKV
ncbi:MULTISPECIES: hypothetical protein [Vibrio]|jgi:hypothetical protein|uniref:hypothetical protein n=1 Tax=Vibrio TaxID=662 RepID=UPI0004E646E2|nr:hypothetical protein [Vibrio parahaemolyticus]ELC9583466.1 hypothetical protein [Vibrio vulnificus]WDE69807.1 hypothetical protein VPHZ6_orf00024 [Vibrio phage VPHZ6]AWG87346.1 hypothetical protein Vp2S01_p20035 [Vibrio parahaemolyticus]KFE94893.1 hypothetical protein HB39_12360 [Vibrio parahaemolyticus]MBX5338969.1 hypothetical protein [Vibrio parahaemolyticus]